MKSLISSLRQLTLPWTQFEPHPNGPVRPPGLSWKGGGWHAPVEYRLQCRCSIVQVVEEDSVGETTRSSCHLALDDDPDREIA